MAAATPRYKRGELKSMNTPDASCESASATPVRQEHKDSLSLQGSLEYPCLGTWQESYFSAFS